MSVEKFRGHIDRLKGQKRENKRKMENASSSTERKHFQMLMRKNREAIEMYRKKIEEAGG